MFEAEFLQVEAVYENVDEPYWILLVNIFVERVWEEYGLFSVDAVYVFAHGCCWLLWPPLLPSLGIGGSSVMMRYTVLPRYSFGQVTLAPVPYAVTCLFMKPTTPTTLISVTGLKSTFGGII